MTETMGVIVTGILFLLFYLIGRDQAPDVGNPDQAASPENAVSVPLQVAQWIPAAKRYASRYGIDWRWIMGILWTESDGIKNASGSSGEVGLMQLKQVAVDDIRQAGYGEFNDYRITPETNIHAGTAFLHLQLKRTGGDIRQAIRAYNQGFAGKDASDRQRRAANEYLAKVENRMSYFG